MGCDDFMPRVQGDFDDVDDDDGYNDDRNVDGDEGNNTTIVDDRGWHIS